MNTKITKTKEPNEGELIKGTRPASNGMEKTLRLVKKIIPKNIFRKIQPIYHYSMAFLGAIIYRFPSKKIRVVAITGTKGKTSTAEIVNEILEQAGYKTALAGTLRIKIAEKSENNKFKMTMPGRFFVQKFLRQAVNAKCNYAIIEMTSEGAKQFRNKFIDLDALIFTNLSPEHIESHGSYENYVKAKVSIAKSLSRSKKPRRILVVNGDEKEAIRFLSINNTEKHVYHINDASPHKETANGSEITLYEKKIFFGLPGLFNIYNALGAVTFAETQNIPLSAIIIALEKIKKIRGRVEKITLNPENPLSKKQDFDVIVDYAHTADSLEKLYKAFPNKEKICVLGNCGGGRDTWKRPEMGKIADNYCSKIILTNEDPYDDDPQQIIDEVAKGITKHTPEIIIDRREAIKNALKIARKDSIVLITGKGTDPYIMEKNGKKTPWDDATVVREELENIFKS